MNRIDDDLIRLQLLFNVLITTFLTSTHSKVWSHRASWWRMQRKVINSRSNDLWSELTEPFCDTRMLGAPSVEIDTRQVVFSPFACKHSVTASQISYPHVWPFSSISLINSFCNPFELIYLNNSADRSISFTSHAIDIINFLICYIYCHFDSPVFDSFRRKTHTFDILKHLMFVYKIRK